MKSYLSLFKNSLGQNVFKTFANSSPLNLPGLAPPLMLTSSVQSPHWVKDCMKHRNIQFFAQQATLVLFESIKVKYTIELGLLGSVNYLTI